MFGYFIIIYCFMFLCFCFIFLLVCVLFVLWLLIVVVIDSVVFVVGVGVQCMLVWLGVKNDCEDFVLYIDVELFGVGSFFMLDGLELEFLYGLVLCGGFYGGYQWGCECSDLGVLGGKVFSLLLWVNLGGYLEW